VTEVGMSGKAGDAWTSIAVPAATSRVVSSVNQNSLAATASTNTVGAADCSETCPALKVTRSCVVDRRQAAGDRVSLKPQATSPIQNGSSD
jgi:hypothetical protein